MAVNFIFQATNGKGKVQFSSTQQQATFSLLRYFLIFLLFYGYNFQKCLLQLILKRPFISLNYSMNTLKYYLKGSISLLIACAFHTAHAQNNPVASPLVMRCLMPVQHLNPAPRPEELAHFYDDRCKDLGSSLAWIQSVNADLPTFWNLYAEAQIHLRLENKPAALAIALRAKQLAEQASDGLYAYLSAEVIRVASPEPVAPAAGIMASIY